MKAVLTCVIAYISKVNNYIKQFDVKYLHMWLKIMHICQLELFIKVLYVDGICIYSFPAFGSATKYHASRKSLQCQIFSLSTIDIS